jgi:hypothetical protein
MLSYEIHVAGAGADDAAERVRTALEAACGEAVDRARPLEDARALALLLPPGIEWSFERLREVVGELRSIAPGCTVSLAGMPEDDGELVRALLRQAHLLEEGGHGARAAALRREAERVRGG